MVYENILKRKYFRIPKEKDRSLRSTDSKSLLLGKEAASRQHRNFNRPARSVRLGNAGQPPSRQEAWGQPPARWETTRHAAGHYEKCLNWANVLEQPPASLRGGCAGSPATLAQSAEVGVESL